MANIVRSIASTDYRGNSIPVTKLYWKEVPFSSTVNVINDYILLHRISENERISNILLSGPTDATLSISVGLLPSTVSDSGSVGTGIALDAIFVAATTFASALAVPTAKAIEGNTLRSVYSILSGSGLSAAQKIAYGGTPEGFWVAAKVVAVATGTPTIRYQMITFSP